MVLAAGQAATAEGAAAHGPWDAAWNGMAGIKEMLQPITSFILIRGGSTSMSDLMW